ncbi:hypothetical protein AJ79_07608 [Helicocarpus griseus UAMH5409]|uniref:Uncharacterized protein n=1 Tax=Helicocarpus griseus UAMH5409 TaxID=1447875 RepID=A0A2B7X0L9_9EURO|nr:hypothetical protein AJ79_07608 [Helicocarpus griseus UAMH5409]
MDLYFSIAEKRLASSVAVAWTCYRFGVTMVRILRGYLNKAAARKQQLRRSSLVDGSLGTTQMGDASLGRT